MLIKNKSDRSRLLEVDQSRGRIQEICRSEATFPPIQKGFFEKWSKGYMYALSGSNGPCLTVGTRSYDFRSPEWQAEVEKQV